MGEGAFGKVYKAYKGDGVYALKMCSVMGLKKNKFFAADGEYADSLEVLYNELNILKRLEHKNIARCYEIINGVDRIVIVNELGTLGQVMEWKALEEKYRRNPKVVEYIGKKFNISSLGDITRLLFLEVCEGVKYLHDQDITNRDIKVDNILCSETSGLGDEVKIIDFTTVRFRPNDDISHFSTGTPGFRAP